MYQPTDCTVIVNTSYIDYCHPCTTMIDRAIQSLELVDLSDSPLLIICDGELKVVPQYEDYKDRLKKKYSKMICMPEKVGLGFCVKEGILNTETPLVFFLQHDFEIIERVRFKTIARLFEDERVQHLKLRRVVLPGSKHKPTLKETIINGVEVTATSEWSANPHFARMEHYRTFVLPKVERSTDYRGLESTICPWAEGMYEKIGFEEFHRQAGTYLLGRRIGEPPKSRHLGGRRMRSPRNTVIGHYKPICCEVK